APYEDVGKRHGRLLFLRSDRGRDEGTLVVDAHPHAGAKLELAGSDDPFLSSKAFGDHDAIAPGLAAPHEALLDFEAGFIVTRTDDIDAVAIKAVGDGRSGHRHDFGFLTGNYGHIREHPG